MVFTEIDKQVMSLISTLVKYTKNPDKHRDTIINIGQHLGVPKDETLGVMEEWDEFDVIEFSSHKDKQVFIQETFEEALTIHDDSVRVLYRHVSKQLGISA